MRIKKLFFNMYTIQYTQSALIVGCLWKEIEKKYWGRGKRVRGIKFVMTC